MPYVKRNAAGKIIAATLEPGEGLAPVAGGAPELQEFMRRMGMEPNSLEQTDLRLVRYWKT